MLSACLLRPQTLPSSKLATGCSCSEPMVLKHEASAVVVVALVINLAIAGAVVVVAVVAVAVVLLVAMLAPLMQSFFIGKH